MTRSREDKILAFLSLERSQRRCEFFGGWPYLIAQSP